MKQATAGSGSAADKSYPDTAAANAELEAKLTGGNSGGAGSAMPNEAQVRVAGSPACKHANCMQRPFSIRKSVSDAARLHCFRVALQYMLCWRNRANVRSAFALYALH